MSCILCLVDCSMPQTHRFIELFSEEGCNLNICNVLSKHFWFKPDQDLRPGQRICYSCWETIRDFHQFYEHVAEVHRQLDSKASFVAINSDKDPLPLEVQLKSEETCSAGKLADVLSLDDNLFDSEVKVEVHDLDLLPQIEIIEETSTLSERAQRANRRNRQIKEPANIAPTAAKRIKLENSSAGVCDEESEPELPLAVLMNIAFKTDINDITNDIEESTTVVETPSAVMPQKRRRGRPRKIKVETADANTATVDHKKVLKGNPMRVAADIDENHEFLVCSGTEDSDSSSGSTDSDKSLPDYEPKPKYAVIPKRVIVKPKKYRKRPKPLVQPKRMSREEIERKNAQQDEYDKVITKFFGSISCPKCDLLVQNFGDIRAHFRASHNEEPGYMNCCGRKFHQRRALAEHVYVHWNPDHYKCTKCDKVLQDSRALELHEQAHTNPPEPKEKKLFHCDKCPKAFTTKAAFEHHTFSKHVPKSEFQFSCTVCSKKLPTQRKLKDHMKYMHDPESAIICDKCGKRVRSQSNLKKHHQLEHSDVPPPTPVPMQCELCGTWYRHLAGLKQHMKSIHEEAGGEHRCSICNKTSTNARALKRHIYHNHLCERKFKCTMCEKAFKRPQDLREHTSTHTGEVLYTCPNCPMTFFSNANMYKHRQRLHRAEWEADRKKPLPPNIMQRAVGATTAMKMQQAVGATSAFFSKKLEHNLTSSERPTINPNLQMNIN